MTNQKNKKEEFDEKFTEFRADGTEYGAGLYLKKDIDLEELEDWIESYKAEALREILEQVDSIIEIYRVHSFDKNEKRILKRLKSALQTLKT